MSASGAISLTSFACTERVHVPLRLLQAPFSFLSPFAHPLSLFLSLFGGLSLSLGITLHHSRAIHSYSTTLVLCKSGPVQTVSPALVGLALLLANTIPSFAHLLSLSPVPPRDDTTVAWYSM